MINRRFESLDGEVWVPIFRDYEISNMGRVVSNKGTFPRIMRTYPNNRDYHLIHIRINNKRRAYTVHRLVAQIFLKNTDPVKVTVNHNFGKDDNRASSLSWMTYSENTRHAVDSDRIKSGDKSHMSILDEAQVRTIKACPELKERELAKYFNVSRGCISSIRRGKSWKHLNRVSQ